MQRFRQLNLIVLCRAINNKVRHLQITVLLAKMNEKDREQSERWWGRQTWRWGAREYRLNVFISIHFISFLLRLFVCVCVFFIDAIGFDVRTKLAKTMRYWLVGSTAVVNSRSGEWARESAFHKLEHTDIYAHSARTYLWHIVQFNMYCIVLRIALQIIALCICTTTHWKRMWNDFMGLKTMQTTAKVHKSMHI